MRCAGATLCADHASLPIPPVLLGCRDGGGHCYIACLSPWRRRSGRMPANGRGPVTTVPLSNSCRQLARPQASATARHGGSSGVWRGVGRRACPRRRPLPVTHGGEPRFCRVAAACRLAARPPRGLSRRAVAHSGPPCRAPLRFSRSNHRHCHRRVAVQAPPIQPVADGSP